MTEEKKAVFERLYREHKGYLERYVFCKVSSRADGEDLLQEILAAAYAGFEGLSEYGRFKSWMLGIAAHKFADYYRQKAALLEIPLEQMMEGEGWDVADRRGREDPVVSAVQETLERLSGPDQKILYLFYIKGYRQKDIALGLKLPLGTVKSRVSAAKSRFRREYSRQFPPLPLHQSTHIPYTKKGSARMKDSKFPSVLPDIVLERLEAAPFSIRLEEVPGWFVLPQVGRQESFAFYDQPDGSLTSVTSMECLSTAEIHGVPCVQISVEDREGDNVSHKTLYVRLTETHCMYIAASQIRNGCFCFSSFMDEDWRANYEIGEDNCGRAVKQSARGVARWTAPGCFAVSQEESPDIVGRYRLIVGGKSFDTVALLELWEGMLTVQYIDAGGRTILFRRYNHPSWKLERYKIPWTEKLPDSERICVNGQEYVHWYDCITEFAL